MFIELNHEFPYNMQMCHNKEVDHISILIYFGLMRDKKQCQVTYGKEN